MAVILDIDLPEGCGGCPLNEDDWSCIVTGKPVGEGPGRPKGCPLLGGDIFRMEPENEKQIPDLLAELKRRGLKT